MKTFRLLALDLDGTLLTNDKQITARTRRALAAAADAGMQIALVTGRPYSGLPEALPAIPGIRYAITSNGAVSMDLSTGKKLRTALMPGSIVPEIIRYPRENGLIYNVFLDGVGYCDRPSFDRLVGFFAGTVLEDYVRRSRRGVDDILEYVKAHPEGVENIWIMGRDQAERDMLAQMLPPGHHLQTFFTAQTDLEIGDSLAGKGLSLEELALSLGIAKEEILAFGDNENDLAMFHSAGTSVAMGNASEYVRSQADLVTQTNENDGVARLLEQLL